MVESVSVYITSFYMIMTIAKRGKGGLFPFPYPKCLCTGHRSHQDNRGYAPKHTEEPHIQYKRIRRCHHQSATAWYKTQHAKPAGIQAWVVQSNIHARGQCVARKVAKVNATFLAYH